jgi:uncharacterized membrane protein YkoI
MSVAMLFVVDSAAARPRSLSLQQTERGGGISLEDATSRALGAFPGTVVGARKVQMGDRVVYEIRILGQDGRTVRTFRIDAETGSFL